jgi:HK97 family phage portal protein
MGIMDIFKKPYKEKPSNAALAVLNGNIPIYTQFGQNIYASDVVQQSIACIAQEISKLDPRHIRFGKNGLQEVVRDEINELFEYGANDWMTTKDFLEKITWQLFLNYNSFILPVFDEYETKDKVKKRIYRALYPLDPSEVTFIQDGNADLWVKFVFADANELTVRYTDIIHWRYRFSVNPFMGGNASGQADTAAIWQTVNINHQLLQSIEKSVSSSMQIHGLLKVQTLYNDDSAKAEIARFEKLITEGKSAILPVDLKSEYVPMKPDPKLVDTDTLEFIDSKILRNYGVPLPILTGDFTDTQYQAFYEKTLEPLINSLNQVFTKTLFTKNERNHGNKIVFYINNLLHMSPEKRVEMSKVLGDRGALTNNALLELFGYPPYEGGDIRLQSLNYVDVNIATKYQMNQSGKKKEVNNDE